MFVISFVDSLKLNAQERRRRSELFAKTNLFSSDNNNDITISILIHV